MSNEPKREPTTMADEYAALRTEIERRSTVQQAVFVLNLTAVGAVVTLALKPGTNGVSSGASSRSYYLLLLIPYVGFALARLWLDHHDAILRIGSYIRSTIESRGAASWETALEGTGRRSSTQNHFMFWGANGIVFLGPSLVALLASAAHVLHHGAWRGVMWAVALGVTILNGYGWSRACWPAKERGMSLQRLRTIFEPRVRANLEWDALQTWAQQLQQRGDTEVEVAMYYNDERSDYTDWWHPWYFISGPNETRIEVREAGGEGRAVALLDAGRLPNAACGDGWTSKDKTVAPFEHEAAAAPFVFDVCVYLIAGGTPAARRLHRLILDGNHHLAAALRSGNTFTARVFEIRNGPARNPDDLYVLQDLARDWDADGVRREGG
jgi:hypothetical protein